MTGNEYKTFRGRRLFRTHRSRVTTEFLIYRHPKCAIVFKRVMFEHAPRAANPRVAKPPSAPEFVEASLLEASFIEARLLPPRGQPPRGQPPRGQPPRGQPPRGQSPRCQPPRDKPSQGQTTRGQLSQCSVFRVSCVLAFRSFGSPAIGFDGCWAQGHGVCWRFLVGTVRPARLATGLVGHEGSPAGMARPSWAGRPTRAGRVGFAGFLLKQAGLAGQSRLLQGPTLRLRGNFEVPIWI